MSKEIVAITDGSNEGDAWNKCSQVFRDQVLPTDQFESLKKRMDAGYSASFCVGGDSTGNETDEWVYLFSQYLAAQYPNYNVDYWLNENVFTPAWVKTELQSAAGGESRVTFTGATNAGMIWPYTAVQSSTAITIEAECDVLSWAAVGEHTLISRMETAGSRVWQLYRSGTLIKMRVSTNGSSLTDVLSYNLAGLAVDDTKMFFKVVFTQNDGGGNNTCALYHKTADNDPWVLLVNQVNVGSLTVTTIDNEYCVGSIYSGAAAVWDGSIYNISVTDGVKQLLPPLMKLTRFPSTFYDNATIEGAPTLTVWNSSQPGVATASLAATVKRWMFPGVDLVMMSSGYNDSLAHEIQPDLDIVLDYAKAITLTPNIALTLQPPSTAPISDGLIEARATRRSSQTQFSVANGLGIIDADKAFIDDGRALSLLVGVDGTHPTAAGYQIWSDLVAEAFDRSY